MNRAMQHAGAFRRLAADGGLAPEGVEFFEWVWVPARVIEACMTITPPDEIATAADAAIAPLSYVSIVPATEVRCECGQLGRVGWSAEHRIAVLFYAAGGPMPPLIVDMSGPIYELTLTGEEKRAEELAEQSGQNILDMLRRLDGEEWKGA